MTGAMRKWHKYLGLAATLLVILVSITGILLIHKRDLGLNKVTVNLPRYAEKMPTEGWYMVSSGEGGVCLSTKGGIYLKEGGEWRLTLPVSAKRLYADGSTVYACTRTGLQVSGDGGRNWRNALPGEEAKALHLSAGKAVAVTAKGVYLRQEGDGKWEQIAPLPGKGLDVREVSVDGSEILLAAKEGLYRVEKGKVKQVKLPGAEKVASGVELQKVITDLHTGAFFGNWFIWVLDLVGIAMVFFSLSGVWLWYVPWKKRRSPRMG